MNKVIPITINSSFEEIEQFISKGYLSLVEFPDRPSRPAAPSRHATSSDYSNYAAKLEQYEQSMLAYQQSRRQSIDLVNQAEVIWKQKLYQTYSQFSTPVLDAIYSFASEKNNGAGYPSLREEFDDTVDFAATLFEVKNKP